KIINRIFEEQFSSEITSIVGNSELKIFIFMPIFYKIKGLNEKIQKAIKYDIQLINLDFLHNSKEWIYPLKQFLTK
nr:hypothetical protein [Clostridia bacterium]